MDCQTFWRSNPKRVEQFVTERRRLEDVDLQAWAIGYYTGLSIVGKFPKKPGLIKTKEEQVAEQSPENQIKAWKNWAIVQQARLIDEQIAKQREASTDG